MRPTVRVRVPARSRAYDVRVGAGLIEDLGAAIRDLGIRRVALLSDDRVGRLHGARAKRSLRKAGIGVTAFLLPPGEKAKTWKAIAAMHEELAAAGFDRGCGVVSLGGGAITDAGGFVAASWMRGVPHVGVPTSLVGMVDAAVGGKTGINLSRGKNLAGAFHHPALVVCDLDLLATLPRRDFRAGLAEVVKTAWLAGGPLWRTLTRKPEAILAMEPGVLADVVLRCVRTKAAVVGRDPEEGGERRALNLGHTIGHGLEAAAGFGALRHGEAVAAGLIGAARVARRLDRTDGLAELALLGRLVDLEVLASVPSFRLPALVATEVLGFIRKDKKMREGRLAFVLPIRPGEVEIAQDVPWTIVRSVVRGLLAE